MDTDFRPENVPYDGSVEDMRESMDEFKEQVAVGDEDEDDSYQLWLPTSEAVVWSATIIEQLCVFR